MNLAINDIKEALSKIEAASGIKPNRLIFGEKISDLPTRKLRKFLHRAGVKIQRVKNI